MSISILKRDEFERFIKKMENTCLPEVMKIYAPTCEDRCLNEVLELRNRIDRVTGGSTTYRAEGCFIMDDRDVCEPVMVIETAHQCFTREQALELNKAISEYALKTGQEYIAIQQGKFYIIKSSELAKALEQRKAIRIL